MKIAYFGTPEFAGNVLSGILEHKNIEIPLVVSQPDKPVGRKKEILATPVKRVALENNIRLLQPEKVRGNEEFFEELKSLNLDFIVVVAYGKILPRELLDIPKYGCINIHGSILPKYRGASPVQSAILNGDTKTGLTIMYMDDKMDEGDMLATKEVEINITDKSPEIFEKFEKIGPNLLVESLEGIVGGKIKGVSQNHDNATYCTKITKEDARVDFTKSSKEIYDKWRAYYPWPGIYTYFEEKKLSIEDCFFDEIDLSNFEYSVGDVIELDDEVGVVCGEGVAILKALKIEGKKTQGIKEFLNGYPKFLEGNLF